jgi:MFS superfamily sulfate permease-like transporter
VLVLAGVSLFDFQALRRIWGISRAEFLLSVVATLGVATIGVLPGIALAIALSVRFYWCVRPTRMMQSWDRFPVWMVLRT